MLIAVSGTSETSIAMAQKKPLGAGNPEQANAKLERIVKEKLEGDEELRQARIVVSADVTANSVTLSGTVASERLRRRAIEAARQAQAGILVNDRIQVKPTAASDARRWLKAKYA